MDATVLGRPELREAIDATGPTRLATIAGRRVLRVLGWDRRTRVVSLVVKTFNGESAVEHLAELALVAHPTGTPVADALAHLAGVVIDTDGRLVRSDPAAAAELARREGDGPADGSLRLPREQVLAALLASAFEFVGQRELDFDEAVEAIRSTPIDAASAYTAHGQLLAACRAVVELLPIVTPMRPPHVTPQEWWRWGQATRKLMAVADAAEGR